MECSSPLGTQLMKRKKAKQTAAIYDIKGLLNLNK